MRGAGLAIGRLGLNGLGDGIGVEGDISLRSRGTGDVGR